MRVREEVLQRSKSIMDKEKQRFGISSLRLSGSLAKKQARANLLAQASAGLGHDERNYCNRRINDSTNT
jgi:hypothetical protein